MASDFWENLLIVIFIVLLIQSYFTVKMVDFLKRILQIYKQVGAISGFGIMKKWNFYEIWDFNVCYSGTQSPEGSRFDKMFSIFY